MRNFDEIFIELDPVKRAGLLAERFIEDCLWIHPGGRIVGRDGINEAATEIRKHFRIAATPSRAKSEPCTTWPLVGGEAACQVNRFTTRERTSSNNAMAAMRWQPPPYCGKDSAPLMKTG
jgi:hypothetical protein